jgi:uridylate kinase
VIDQTAFTMAQENKIDLIVFGLKPEGNVLRVVQGERIGTLVTAD